jgi:hypothetical protein
VLTHLKTNDLMHQFPLFFEMHKKIYTCGQNLGILMLNFVLHTIMTRFQKVKPMPSTERPRKQVS